jgi:protein tyrosine/serine phosphatase
MAKKDDLRLKLLIILLIVLVCIVTVKHFHIKNFHTVKSGVLYTSGQPKGMDYYRLLYKYNIGTFVNVRLAYEHRDHHWYNEEISWVRKNGVRYIELPFAKRPEYFPDKSIVRDFIAVMETKSNRPVLLHSSSGEERGAMLASAWLIIAEDYTIDEAAKVIRKIMSRKAKKEELEYLRKMAAVVEYGG